MKIRFTKDFSYKANKAAASSDRFTAGVTYRNVTKDVALAAAAAGATDTPEALALLKDFGGKTAFKKAQKDLDKKAVDLKKARQEQRNPKPSTEIAKLKKQLKDEKTLADVEIEARTKERDDLQTQLDDQNAAIDLLIEAYNRAAPDDDKAETLDAVTAAFAAMSSGDDGATGNTGAA